MRKAISKDSHEPVYSCNLRSHTQSMAIDKIHSRIQKVLSEGANSNIFMRGERGSKYHYKRAITGTPAKRRFASVPMMDQQCDFQGPGPVMVRNPTFCDFSGVGVRTPCPLPPLDLSMKYHPIACKLRVTFPACT